MLSRNFSVFPMVLVFLASGAWARGATVVSEVEAYELCGNDNPVVINRGVTTVSGRQARVAGFTNQWSGFADVIDSSLTVTGPAINNGTLNLLDSQAYFEQGLTTNGPFLYDPSTITVSTLIVGPNGYLAETGDPGDRFIITEDFINQSTRNTDWNTVNTIFQFNGGLHTVVDPQTIEAAGVDLGNVAQAWTDNFHLGVLQIGTSQTYVQLADDFDNSAPCLGAFCSVTTSEAMYVGDLILESGVTLDLNNLNLYVLGSFTDNGATVINGSITTGLVSPDGDVDGDGDVDTVDVLLAQRFVAGLVSLSPAAQVRADVAPLLTGVPDPDGMVLENDVLLIQRKAAGLASF